MGKGREPVAHRHPGTDEVTPANKKIVRALRALRTGKPDRATVESLWHHIVGEVGELTLHDAMYRLKTLPENEMSPEAQQRTWRRVSRRIVRSTGQVSPQNRMPEAERNAVAAGRNAARYSHDPPGRRPFFILPAWYLLGMALLIIILIAFSATAHASLPGSFLYPAKRLSEEVRLQFTVIPGQRTRVVLVLARRRHQETEQLVDNGAPVDLVVATTETALGHLQQAMGAMPEERIKPHLEGWYRSTDRWPDTYTDPLVDVIDARAMSLPFHDAGSHPEGLEPRLPAVATRTPTPVVTPTAAETIVVHQVPAQPSWLPGATPTVTTTRAVTDVDLAATVTSVPDLREVATPTVPLAVTGKPPVPPTPSVPAAPTELPAEPPGPPQVPPAPPVEPSGPPEKRPAAPAEPPGPPEKRPAAPVEPPGPVEAPPAKPVDVPDAPPAVPPESPKPPADRRTSPDAPVMPPRKTGP